VTERTNIRCEWPFAISSPLCLPACGAARWPLFSPPACRQPRGSLPGWDRPFFLLDWPALEPQITRRHMKKRRRSLGRPLLHARALCGDHGAPRRSPQKPRVVDRGHISTGQYSRCAGRATRGPDVRWGVGRQSDSLNRHRIWPGCENGHGHVKEACAGLKALCKCCQRMGHMPGHVAAWSFGLGAAAQDYGL
jgi:hypothetical protein